MNAKRFLVGLLTGVLIAVPVMQPIAAYAEMTNAESGLATVVDTPLDDQAVVNDSTEVESDSSVEPDSQIDGNLTEENVSGADSAEVVSDEQDGAAALSESLGVEASVSEIASGEETPLEIDSDESNASDVPVTAVEFVYIDQSIVSIGEQQNIAIGLVDTEEVLASASLELVDLQGERSTVDASNIVDSSALFTILYTDDSQVDAYTIVRLSYTVLGSSEELTVDFSDDTNEANDYTYQVVKADFVDALDASGTENGVTAITIDDNGELQPADSVEDAIESVDGPGVVESKENATAPSVAASRARSAVTSTREDYLIVAIDPGHGGNDGGTSGNGLQEKNVNWNIAQAFKKELDTYTGVTA